MDGEAAQVAFIEDRIERMRMLLACAVDVATRTELEACLRALEQRLCRLARAERVLETA